MKQEKRAFLRFNDLFAAFLVIMVIIMALPTMPVLADEPTPTPAPAYQLPFPRLGMWWPDPSTQPLEAIARYDWVILGDWSTDYIDPIRAINPDILLLTSTNACELSFNPDDPAANAALQNIPPQWFLTQVGSTLSADVNAAQTTLPVAALSIQDGGKELELFAPGDTLLLEGESALVEKVDKANRTLTVQRGYVRPAAAHKAGARIAAHISFWPNSWLLNLSTLSPIGVADSAVGAERWADYNARQGAQLLNDPRWAGILVDRSDPDESWLIGNSTARSIDPDQSNRLLSDYSAFDSAWNEGLRVYLDELRAAVGSQRIIYLNWGIPHYTAVNGNNFEGFPDGDGFRNWHSLTLGPTASGSYFEWMRQARQPNLTMLETYEDESGPKPDDADGYANRCNDPDFTPNYRKMRFGLTTALLNDGYFSYEMNTEGHGSLCLMWFDEYDNAGAGRGYLGLPLGAAQQVTPKLGTPNLLVEPAGGAGEDLLAAWETSAEIGYELTAALDDENPVAGESAVRLDVLKAQGVDWRAAFSYAPVALQKNKEYTLTFQARADQPRTVTVWAQQNHYPWDNWLWFGAFNLTAEWQQFELPTASLGDDKQARLLFGVGSATGSVWLDEINLQEGNNDVWRREFEHGIVLVNATAQAVTLPLGGNFVKIDGQQDRTVNDGAEVNQVTLPPQDGIILLKQ